MTDPIADVLREHEWTPDWPNANVGECRAKCDGAGDGEFTYDTHIEHVAAAVRAALTGDTDLTALDRYELIARCIMLAADVASERAHGDRWQQLAGRYDDIRYALRNASDTPEGHAAFYNECAELIFGPSTPGEEQP